MYDSISFGTIHRKYHGLYTDKFDKLYSAKTIPADIEIVYEGCHPRHVGLKGDYIFKLFRCIWDHPRYPKIPGGFVVINFSDDPTFLKYVEIIMACGNIRTKFNYDGSSHEFNFLHDDFEKFLYIYKNYHDVFEFRLMVNSWDFELHFNCTYENFLILYINDFLRVPCTALWGRRYNDPNEITIFDYIMEQLSCLHKIKNQPLPSPETVDLFSKMLTYRTGFFDTPFRFHDPFRWQEVLSKNTLRLMHLNLKKGMNTVLFRGR